MDQQMVKTGEIGIVTTVQQKPRGGCARSANLCHISILVTALEFCSTV